MQDNVIPNNKWEFNEDVSMCFEDMLKRSIPQYDTMRQLTFDIAKNFVVKGQDIIDIGCSNGLALEKFVSHFGAGNRFIGLEISEPMIEKAKEKFKGYLNTTPQIVDIRKHNLKAGFPAIGAPCVILSILTIQFIPIEYRLQLLQSIYDNLSKGGCFVFIEKVLGNSADIDTLMVSEYYKLKENNGYSSDQITRKKESLEGVLVPVTAKWNEELLRMAGFNKIDCFWRYLNFSGWIAIK